MNFRLWVLVIITIVAVTSYVLISPRNGVHTSFIQASGEATIGGEFVLTNQFGKQVSSNDLRGKWLLMYFGFTHCPAICPTDVAHITAAKHIIDSKEVVPVFITVDPERDTSEQLQSYFSSFHPEFIALTGSVEAIKAVEQAYKVYSQKVEDDTMSEYTMNHSAYTYLINPEGKYVTHYRHNTSGEDMAKDVLSRLSGN